MLFAVNATEVARPLLFVVAVFTPPAKVPLAPLAGAVKVTVTPATGLLAESVTVTTSGAENVVRTAVLWPLPVVAAMLAIGFAVLVSAKFATAATLATVAVTL